MESSGCFDARHREGEIDTPSSNAEGASRPRLWNAGDIGKSITEPSSFSAVMDWIRGHIIKPNRELGRTGPVCPFVAPALHLGCLWISVIDTEIRDVEEMCRILRSHLDIYESFESNVGAGSGLRTFIIAFPNLKREDCASLIDHAHAWMKPAVVELGLMLGEFHPGSASPGVHNPKFYPLRSPIPLFVLRQMTPGDLVFLNKPDEAPDRRVQFLRAYLKSMKGVLSAEREEEVRRALAASESEVRFSRTVSV